MNNKSKSIGIISDLKLINKKLNEFKLDNKLKAFIDKNIYYIKDLLKDLVVVKKHGSYATRTLFNLNNNSNLNIDLLAVKHTNKKLFDIYLQDVETQQHYDDCWICELNEEIYKRLSSKYSNLENIKLKWNIEKKKIDENKFLIFKNSISIEFYKNNNLAFSIIIRTGLTQNNSYHLICSNQQYKKTFSLQYVKTYNILNNLLNKKLQLLFLFLDFNFNNKITKKNILFLKILVMSDIQIQLATNNNYRIWLNEVYYYIFSSRKELDDLFENKDIYYHYNKKFIKLLKSVQLKNLNWVFRGTYSNTKQFLDYYLNMANKYSKNSFKEFQELKMYFLYDINSKLTNSNGSSSITLKNKVKSLDNMYISKIIKNVYPEDKEIGVFLVFLNYFRFEIV